MDTALKGAVRTGSAASAAEAGPDVAGKPGTTADRTAGWFVGYNGQVSTAVTVFRADLKDMKLLSLEGGRRRPGHPGLRAAHPDLDLVHEDVLAAAGQARPAVGTVTPRAPRPPGPGHLTSRDQSAGCPGSRLRSLSSTLGSWASSQSATWRKETQRTPSRLQTLFITSSMACM